MGSKPSGLSASRAAAIVGMSDFKTPVSVWLDIMEDIEPGFATKNGFTHEPFTGNASTRWGTAFESAVIALAEIEQGDGIVDHERFYELPGDVPLTCHLDGVYENEGHIHEGKTTTSYSFRDKWGEPGTDRIPRDYAVQVQHQLAVAQKPSTILSVLVFPERPDSWEKAGMRVDPKRGRIITGSTVSPDYPAAIDAEVDDLGSDARVVDSCLGWARVMRGMGFFHQYRIEANAATQDALLLAERDFWKEYVIGVRPPEPKRYADIKALFTEPKGTIVANAEMLRLASERKLINAELAAMEKRKDQICTDLVSRMAAVACKPLDDDSVDKWVLRGPSGAKLAQYGRNGKGKMEFR